MSNPTNSGQQPQEPKKESKFFCNPLQCRCGHHYFPQRIVLAILLHICLQNNFTTRVSLNVAIVEMVNPAADEPNLKPACPEFAQPHLTAKGGKFPWPRETKSLVLYSFYVGYTLTQVPGGWLADKYGARPVIVTSVFFTTLITAAFPIATQTWGYIAAVVFRFIIGMSHGFCMPALSSMVSTWFPPKERSIWGGIAYAGTNLGTIMGTMITGILIHAYDGWPIGFYFWGGYSAVYFLLILLLLYSFPDTHPFISEEEVNFIKENNTGYNKPLTKRSLKTPWKAILLNVPYWANITAQFGHNYIYLSLVTYLPTYMREILEFDVQSDGYFSAIPFIALWSTSLILSFTSPYFIKCTSQWFFNCFFGAGSNVASSLLVLGAVYAGCNRHLCIGLYIICMIVKAFYYVTLPVNINALSKNYGGIMFGLCNAVGSISGIIGNFLIGALTHKRQFSEWQLVFWITLGVCVITTIIFAIFSSTERQEFDYDEDEPRPQPAAQATNI